MYVSSGIRIKPIVFGGGHQRGLRSGTENVPAIAALGQAITDIYQDFDKKIERMYELKQAFIKEISKQEGVTINGLPKECSKEYLMEEIKKTAPHIISVSFQGVRSEVLLHALEGREGVYVSSGSACSSHHPEPSATLLAIGIAKDLLDSTIRYFHVGDDKQGRDRLCHRADKGFTSCIKKIYKKVSKEERLRCKMYKAFLIKYAEIGLKGKNRYLFENALRDQNRRSLKPVRRVSGYVKNRAGFFLKCPENYDYEETVAALQRVFGISSICPVVVIEGFDWEKLTQGVGDYVEACIPIRISLLK